MRATLSSVVDFFAAEAYTGMVQSVRSMSWAATAAPGLGPLRAGRDLTALTHRGDLDLANVRAFVAAVLEGNFGRAARRLFLSQQGLSKRISRLESALGVELFDRSGNAIALTDAGERFLPHASGLIELADVAVAASKPASATPLRVDVWGDVVRPMRLARDAAQARGLRCDISMRRNTADAVTALQRGEIDAAFGMAHHVDSRDLLDVEHRLVALEALGAIVTNDHPLAARDQLTVADVARHGVFFAGLGAGDGRQWTLDFVHAFRIPIEIDESVVVLDHGDLSRLVAHHADRLAMYGTAWPPPPDPTLRVVPIVEPTPCIPWSVLWSPANRHPLLVELLTALDAPARLADRDRDRVWTGLPDGPRRFSSNGH
jgi:DNA-binding transcriptional LysR family regulator